MGDPVGSCISQASFKRYDTVIIDIYHLNVSIVTCHDDYINLGILVLLICRICFYWLFFVLKNQRMIDIYRPTQIIHLTQHMRRVYSLLYVQS